MCIYCYKIFIVYTSSIYIVNPQVGSSQKKEGAARLYSNMYCSSASRTVTEKRTQLLTVLLKYKSDLC